MSESKKLAFLGLGVMGYPMAGHLAKAGHHVTVYNRNAAKAKAWVEQHPEIKTKIEERIRNVPAANRERAYINAAKTEAMNQTVRTNGIRP